MPDPLPVHLPGKITDFKAMYDAQYDAEDLWIQTQESDGTQAISHLFWRKGAGWSVETLATGPA